MAFADFLKSLEGSVPAETLKAIASQLEQEAKTAAANFIQANEEKYGITPSTVADTAPETVQAPIATPVAAPIATPVAAPQDASPVQDAVPASMPPDMVAYIKTLVSQVETLTSQVAALKSSSASNQTTTVMGQGEPVNHTLFLEDGTVIKNHPGVATHVSTDNGDGTDTVKRVVAAYPTN